MEIKKLAELRNFLKSQGYNQNQIAEKLGVSRVVVSTLLNGREDFGKKRARYTWASIAANECNLSVDTIALALGHTYGLAVTLGYISPDMGRVDKANEQVIAKVFGE